MNKYIIILAANEIFFNCLTLKSLIFDKFFNTSAKKKGAYAPVGIKNSWKYEKDLIILNEMYLIFTITRVSCFYLKFQVMK